MIHPEDIPYSVYNGPIDFKFVKDAERREAKVATYTRGWRSWPRSWASA